MSRVTYLCPFWPFVPYDTVVRDDAFATNLCPFWPFVPYDTVVRDAFATNLCPFWPYVPYDTVGLSCHMIAMVHDTLGTIFCLTSTSHVL